MSILEADLTCGAICPPTRNQVRADPERGADSVQISPTREWTTPALLRD